VRVYTWVCSGCGEKVECMDGKLPDQWVKVKFRNGVARIKGTFCSIRCLEENLSSFFKKPPVDCVFYK